MFFYLGGGKKLHLSFPKPQTVPKQPVEKPAPCPVGNAIKIGFIEAYILSMFGIFIYPSSSSSLYIWNQGSIYLIYWQLGTWFRLYWQPEDEGTLMVDFYGVYIYIPYMIHTPDSWQVGFHQPEFFGPQNQHRSSIQKLNFKNGDVLSHSESRSTWTWIFVSKYMVRGLKRMDSYRTRLKQRNT